MLHDIGEDQEVDPLDDISAFIIPPPPTKQSNYKDFEHPARGQKSVVDRNSGTSTTSTLISNQGSGDRDINETLTCNDVKVAKVKKLTI